MFIEITKYAKIMYEKNFIYGLNGSISTRFEDDSFIINKSLIYSEENSFFTKLLLNENYKYKDACKMAKLHALIYNNFAHAKVIAIVCSKEILRICRKSELNYKNKKFYIESEDILKDNKLLLLKLNKNELNFILIQNIGLVIFERDFNTLFARIFDIDLEAKISCIN